MKTIFLDASVLICLARNRTCKSKAHWIKVKDSKGSCGVNKFRFFNGAHSSRRVLKSAADDDTWSNYSGTWVQRWFSKIFNTLLDPHCTLLTSRFAVAMTFSFPTLLHSVTKHLKGFRMKINYGKGYEEEENIKIISELSRNNFDSNIFSAIIILFHFVPTIFFPLFVKFLFVLQVNKFVKDKEKKSTAW